MTADKIISALASKKFQPIYFLGGEESYFIDKVMKYAQDHILGEAERAFNQMSLYGKETSFKTVVDNARQFPMMAEHRVLFLKEAQSMRDFDKLETYVNNPSPQTILFISYKHKKPDGRKNIIKVLKKKSVYLQSDKIKDYKLADWISSYVHELGYKINGQASGLLAEYLGNDLQKIENEIAKATISFAQGQELNMKVIQERIGISKDYNVYELQRAIGNRQLSKVIHITENMSRNMKNNPMPLVIGSLFRFFTQLFYVAQNASMSDQAIAGALRINPYFIKDIKASSSRFTASQYFKIFDTFKDYDLKSKGLGRRSTEDGELFRELIYQLMYAA